MKIVLVIPTLISGGAERVMSELANEFSLRNNEVHLVLLVKSVSFFKVDDSVRIHELGFENRNKLYKIYDEIKTFIRLRRLLKNERPDMVLSFMPKYNVFTILASRFLKLRVFVSDRNNPKKEIPFFINFLRNRTYKYATGIVAQTKVAKDILEATTKNQNIRVIPNPVRKVVIHSNIKREKIIITAGRLIPQKGQKYLIEAFSKLEKPDWQLIILGEGELRGDLENQTEVNKLTERVIMPGAVKNIDEWFARSSIFCFPSIFEGFPNALVEGMAAGLACVSFNCDTGPNEIIHHRKNGLLIPVKDVDSLKDSIDNLIEDINLRIELGTEAKKVSDTYNIEKIGQEYLDFCKGD